MLEESNTSSGAAGYVWVALIIFVLMVFLGWLVSSRGWLKKDDEPMQSGHINPHEEPDHGTPAPATAVRTMNISEDDDLVLIEGIGPKVAKLLAGIGVTTFSGLASADPTKVRAALDGAGYKYMDPASWFEQASLAAKGDMEGLKKLQDSLKGGRKIN